MTSEIKQYWDLIDDDLHAIYDQALEHRLLDRVAYDARMGRGLFLLFVRRAECFCALKTGERWSGFFYLSHFEGATARLHLALPELPSSRTGGQPSASRTGSAALPRPAAPAPVIRQVLDWCFETFGFKSLFIVTPASDQAAAALWSGLGAERLADIPGLCWLEKQKKTAAGSLFVMRPLPWD